MTFNINEYVDVAERITEFYERYPNGRLTSETPWLEEAGDRVYVCCRARAYRTPEDPLPGDGLAWEPVPGPTQFTKDSELMNAQTSAWGRAIVALGFATKKIASRDEVENRTGAQEAMDKARDLAANDTSDLGVEITFGKHKGKRVDEVPRAYLEWLIENFEPKSAAQEAVLYAAKERLGLVTSGFSYSTPDDDIPF